jgi:hypothetical protein
VSQAEPWTCPFCNRGALIRRGDQWTRSGTFEHPLTPEERKWYHVKVVFCPNPECRKFTLSLDLFDMQRPPSDELASRIRLWNLLPESAAKPFPNYIPAPILANYNEACLIASLSAKASATLARRCLQGMIRDFWGISKHRLKDEIDGTRRKG